MKDQLYTGRNVTIMFVGKDSINIKITKVYDDGVMGTIIPMYDYEDSTAEMLIPFSGILGILLDTEDKD